MFPFFLWYLLFESFKSQWQGLRAVFCFVGIEMPDTWPAFCGWRGNEKDRNSESCQLRALQNSFPKSPGPRLCIWNAAAYRWHPAHPTPHLICAQWNSCLSGAWITLSRVSAHLHWSTWVRAKCAQWIPGLRVSGKPETEQGEGKVNRIGVWWSLLGALGCPERESCLVPHSSGYGLRANLGYLVGTLAVSPYWFKDLFTCSWDK